MLKRKRKVARVRITKIIDSVRFAREFVPDEGIFGAVRLMKEVKSCIRALGWYDAPRFHFPMLKRLYNECAIEVETEEEYVWEDDNGVEFPDDDPLVSMWLAATEWYSSLPWEQREFTRCLKRFGFPEERINR